MASIRARISIAFTLALLGTLGGMTLIVRSQRKSVAEQDLRERAHVYASIAIEVLSGSGIGDSPVFLYNMTRSGSQQVAVGSLSPRVKVLLEALPAYVIVTDSDHVVFASQRVMRLRDREREDQLFRNAPLISATLKPIVPLDSDLVLLAERMEVPRQGQARRAVIVGMSLQPVEEATREVVKSMSVSGAVILLLSFALAWMITGRLQQIDRMVDDVEAISDGRSLHRRIPVEHAGDEIGRLGTTLNAMIARLEVSFAALRRFTADASHELKTPLTVLRADIERAMTAPARGTEQLVALEEALQETTRMADLVESLLTLARADEGRFDLHREPVALDALARDVAETAHILGETGGHEVLTNNIVPVTVLGDRVRLRQLFLNLITNAIKYTPKGGQVELALEVREDMAAFSVRDTGIGIAGADLPFIFDRFWRVDRARSRTERGGVGLGLAISQYIAQAHGGSITVASRMGRGSTFTVSIPVAPVGTAE